MSPDAGTERRSLVTVTHNDEPTEGKMKSSLSRIGFLLLAFPALPALAAVSFVQEADQAARSATTVHQAFRASTAAGDLLVVGVLYDTSATVSSVTDSQGNAYAAVSSPAVGASASGNATVYYAKNIHGGSDTVTVTLSSSASFADVYVLEYAGADAANPLDAATGAAGTGSVGNGGAVTTTSAGDLLLGICADGGGVPSAGTGFTVRSLDDDNIVEDAQETAVGSFSATANLGGSYPWACQTAAFRPAGSSTSATESVALSAKFTWDTGSAVQGSVILSQQTTSGSTQIGKWTINSQGSVSATLTLQVWGVYTFELLDASGNVLKNGAIVAFPTLKSGSLQVVLVSATKQVKSANFGVAMGDLITTAPS
jgi:flagellar basal body L-ring protein FlgH